MLIARKMTDKKAHTHIRTRKRIVILSHTSLTVVCRSTRGTGPRHLAQTLAAALVEFSFGSAWLTRQPLGDLISSTCVWAKL